MIHMIALCIPRKANIVLQCFTFFGGRMLYQESVLEEEFNLEGEGHFETLLSIMTRAVLKIAVSGALMRPALGGFCQALPV